MVGYQDGLALWYAPDNVVALDIDAPLQCFTRSQGLCHIAIREIRELCRKLSSTWGLGRFWLYYTGSGFHAIFELPCMAWIDVLEDATDKPVFRECIGHLCHCSKTGRCHLRIGHKKDREWDIYPLADNPAQAPGHIREHDRLLSLKLPYNPITR